VSRTTLNTTVAPGGATAVVGARAAALVDVGADDPRADPLLAAIEAGGGEKQILEALAEIGFTDLPSLAVVVDDEAGLRVLARGSVEVEVDGAGDPSELSGAGSWTWRETAVAGARGWELRLGSGETEVLVPIDRGIVDASVIAGEVVDDPGSEPEKPPTGSGGDPTEADSPAGVAGGGPIGAAMGAPFLMAHESEAEPAAPGPETEPAGSEPLSGSDDQAMNEGQEDEAAELEDHEEPATVEEPEEGATLEEHDEPPTVEEPEAFVDFEEPDPEAITMTDEQQSTGSPEPEPGFVDAVVCPHGHLSRPDEAVCLVCETPVEDDTVHRVERPVLATLLWDSGRAVDVDAPLAIGRNPSGEAEMDGETARIVRVPDPDAVLSRHHLDVRLSGWDLLVEDRGSRNHTVMIRPGEEPERLPPEVPWLAPMGTEVVLAEATVFRVDPPPEPEDA